MLVTEITVNIGATIKMSKDYEFVRIDISNKAVLPEPLNVDSKEYRLAHKKLVAAVDGMVEKAKSQIVVDVD